ncbi:alpha/beta hydrolase [Variovorax sp. LjRoot290]|uniref:alpha/beta hydrolase n=1 Tax=unclassified Variovorax TaxID=663243 RepID=UPI000886421F|nr:alpha/beta hydrolase [Variovorax sp. CF079]SDE96054.1 Alpha/beta hydrolase of unknown function [Variovorax sp. CF079]
MLIFTNRLLTTGTDEAVFSTSFIEQSDRLGLATVKKTSKGWSVSGVDNDVDNQDSMGALRPLFEGSRPVLVYLHGNNNTPAKCFARCATLEAMYNVEVVGFSWPSEGYLSNGDKLPEVEPDTEDGDEDDLSGVAVGKQKPSRIKSKILRYQRAKTNAINSGEALARFFRMVAAARLFINRQPFTIAAHSLGAHFLQYSLDVAGATESVAAAQNVALLAPCVRSSGHRDWLANVRPKGQVFVTFNKNDTVLAGAFIADKSQFKLGAAPGSELLRAPHMRYVNFTNGEVGKGGHGYFVNDGMPKKMKLLFERVFSSERDLQGDEAPKKVYLVGCDADGLTCYMGAPGIPGIAGQP